ncbi:hypothetical protein HCY45_11115 [Acinetobacter radioresistens]|uniref:hypothetical protein n=1 Tax=Acinetobacter radioresistens TaxID=40216 RepID=UPI002004F0D8|nr:hypothetical protein [Acinetobacter radioresistens]MCK4099726.1 hypothetical protein [Acinetobacter radioresistens]
MPDGSYNNSLEKKVDSIQLDIRIILEHVARQTFINEANKANFEEIREDLDKLCSKVSTIENKSSAAEGGITVIKIAITLLSGVFIGVCTWVGSSIIQTTQENSLLKEKIARLEADVATLRDYPR